MQMDTIAYGFVLHRLSGVPGPGADLFFENNAVWSSSVCKYLEVDYVCSSRE